MTSRDGAEPAWATLPGSGDGASSGEGVSIHAADLGHGTPEPVVSLPVDLPTMLRQIENAYINAALTQTHCNKKEAAKLLGMGRTTLVEKLRRRTAAASRA
jgi:DNA-binding NtrC family response regulator